MFSSQFLFILFAAAIGVDRYDKIGIISNNRYEWAMIAAATYSLNATLVPMYEAQLPTDWRYIINDSFATVLFCSTKDIFDRVNKEVLPMAPQVHSTLCLDAVDGEEYGYQTAVSRIYEPFLLEQSSMMTPPSEEDLANLIYTSGTTGKPKGVELTHRNIVSNIKGGRSMSENPFDLLDESSRTLAFLPWYVIFVISCLQSTGSYFRLSHPLSPLLSLCFVWLVVGLIHMGRRSSCGWECRLVQVAQFAGAYHFFWKIYSSSSLAFSLLFQLFTRRFMMVFRIK